MIPIPQQIPLLGKHIFKWLLFGLLIAVTTGCSITRNLDDHQQLLNRNSIRVMGDEEKHNFRASELERFHQQRPNRKMLWVIPFHAAAYNYGERINIADSTDYSNVRKWFWMRRYNYKNWILKNGEAPVVFDTAAASRTLHQFESFLFTRGHFHATADKVVTPTRRKRVNVTYNIFPGPGHTVREIHADIPTPAVQKLYEKHLANARIHEGMPYNERMLQDERGRITRLLRENGYYHFDKAYILIEVDTFMPGNQLDIYFRIRDQTFVDPENAQNLITKSHIPARIRNIYVNPEFEGVFAQRELRYIPVEYDKDGSGETKTYHFYSSGNDRFKQQVLIRNIFLEPGQLYDVRDVERTYLQLTDLANFSSVSITFTNADTMISHLDTVILIDCRINLMRMQRQYYEINLDATNRAGDPGITSYFVYQNRNLFRGAEVMSLSLKGALETQKIADQEPDEHMLLWFGTMEFGADVDIRVPRFVAPFNLARLSKSFNPRTRFSGGFNYQERTDFKRYVFKLNSGYEWQYKHNIFMTFYPFEINAVSIFPTKEFQQKIEELNDPRLRNAYSDHIIAASRVIMMIDNQGSRTRRSFSYMRFTFESAGLLVNSLRNPLGYTRNDEGFATLFNIPYAQYLRGDIDYRHFLRLRRKDQMLAARIYIGIGNPYGNMNVLPFEKSFYVGGTNGLRAWPMRTVGPGSFGDQSAALRFDRSGDMAFESSIEYRFPMYGNIHGAAFLDAGNVWLKNPNPRFPGGEFQLENFFNELALGTGFGFRIVTFFVIRVDAGVKLHDPSRMPGERWVANEISLRKINWNFGIGYSI